MILLKIALLSLLASVLVVSVRFLIVPGIDKASKALKFGSKTRGILLGYVTSVPEWVIVVSSAAAGVYDAGFWNIASSNIINWALFLGAVFAFRQSRDLGRKTSFDEIAFGIFSVLLPLALYHFEIRTSALLAFCLIIVFLIYKTIDRSLIVKESVPKSVDEKIPSLKFALASIGSGLVLIVVSGFYIGNIAGFLIQDLGVSAWMIGWILGLISSIPETSGFIEIYRKYKQTGTLKDMDDTQEALNTLVASNMSNLCIILPCGIIIASLV